MSFTTPGSNDNSLGQMTISAVPGKYVLILNRMRLAKYAKYLIPFVLFLVIFFIVYKTFRAPEPVGVDVNEGFSNKKKKKLSDNLWSGWNKKSKKSKDKPAKATKGKSVKAASVGGGSGGKSFGCKLTFYTADPKENHGYNTNADGSKLNAGSKSIAVSKGRWNELKGKRIDIKGHGTYTVKDRCAGCASNQIDILVGSKSEAMKKGVQNSTCSVL